MTVSAEDGFTQLIDILIEKVGEERDPGGSEMVLSACLLIHSWLIWSRQ